MTKRLAFLAALTLAVSTQAVQAQAPVLDVRLGAQTAAPTGRMADFYDYGYGLYGRVGVPAGPVTLMGSVTWTRFKPESSLLNDLDIVTIQFGPHFAMVPGLDFGLEAAYFTEVEELGFTPNISVGIPNLEATLSYNMTFDSPRTSWFALGVGLKF